MDCCLRILKIFKHVSRSTKAPFNQKKPHPVSDSLSRQETASQSHPLFNHSDASAIRLTPEVNLGPLANPPRSFEDSVVRFNKSQSQARKKTLFIDDARKLYDYWMTRKPKKELKNSSSQETLTTLMDAKADKPKGLEKVPSRDSLSTLI
jgi:hypothetical protein